MKNTILISTLLFLMLTSCNDSVRMRYKDSRLSVEERVSDLLGRMSLEEKVAQLRSFHMGRPKLTGDVLGDSVLMDSLFCDGVGMMNPDFDATAEETIGRRNALQQYLKTKTRLGIPTLFIDEAHHGLLAPGADVFPTSISLSSSWDTSLVKRVYTYIASEASSKGTHWVLAPVVDVCRDPRWGRTGETYGEDPFLCGIMGSAVVKGYQGSSDGTVGPGHVAATLKHFTGHGQSEGGINQAPANYPERTLREMHMEPFRICINESHPAGIMAAYCEIDGVPCHANSWLLTDVLRKEWGYKGIVVSDWYAIDQLWGKHFIVPDQESAVLASFNAGVTIDLPYGNNYKHLASLVNEGKVPIKAIDAAVRYILTAKFNMGLFEQAEIDIKKAEQLKSGNKGRSLAREAAEKSIILLKNENNLLPLSSDKYKKIAVVGPCAAVNYLGDYSGIPVHNVSLLEGIKNRLKGSDVKVLYSQGVPLTTNGDTISMNNYQYISTAVFPDEESCKRSISQAVATARGADVIIVAVGENEQLSREAGTNRMGDMCDLNLQSGQDDLIKAMVETGKPVIVYLMHGRPLSINYAAGHAMAIVDGWFNGEEAGNAFASVLFGDVNPSGKLTISIPRSAGQLPVFYNHKPSSRTYDYVTQSNKPLFPFGYGLSYTTFQYSKPVINDRTLSVSITNTGNREGQEVVQMYVRDKICSVTRPVKELKAFKKLSLLPGQTKTIDFVITDDMLKFWNKEMKFGTEPGEFDIMVGPNSDDLQTVIFNL